MKRLLLGGLLSCMLIGQVFCGSNDNKGKALLRGLVEGSVTTAAPFAISYGLHAAIDAAACVSAGINPLGKFIGRQGIPYSNATLIPDEIAKSPVLTSLDQGVGYTTILGTLGLWGWNIYNGVQSLGTEPFVSAGRLIGSTIVCFAVMKWANLARAK